MSTCIDCGQIHRTGLDGIRCDLEHHGKPYVRRRLVDLGLTDQQIDGLIDEAGRRTDDGFVNGGYMVRGLNDLATTADPTPQTDGDTRDEWTVDDEGWLCRSGVAVLQLGRGDRRGVVETLNGRGRP